MRKITCFITALVFSLCFVSLASSNQPRIVDLGNGIYQDNKTGLMWQHGKSRRLLRSQEAALQYAATIGLGGHTDWRLPTMEERWVLLEAFTDNENGGLEFPKYTSKFWTTETEKGIAPVKMELSCMCLGNKELEFKKKGYVRVVRSEKSVQ